MVMTRELAGGILLVVVTVGLIMYILYPKPTSTIVFTTLAAAGTLAGIIKTIGSMSYSSHDNNSISSSNRYNIDNNSQHISYR